jgi:hypothetical protein
MTLSIDGTEIGQIVEIASIVGSILGILIVSLIVYLMIRPPRHVRERRKAGRRGEIGVPEHEEPEAEDLRRVADRMEARLEVLERALADQIERPAIGRRDEEELQPTFAPVEGRDSGRKE